MSPAALLPEGAVELARHFHEVYERRAPAWGYETRPESATDWDHVPESNRMLMIETVAELMSRHLIDPGPALEVSV